MDEMYVCQLRVLIEWSGLIRISIFHLGTERNIVNCTEYLESKLYSTPVADPKLLAEFPKFFESIEKKYYTYPDDSAWYLKIIAINPKHQRKGVGRKMVQWGVSKSEEEGVPALLEASPAGEGLYLSMGYEDVGGETLTAESGEHASLRVMKRYPKNKSSVR